VHQVVVNESNQVIGGAKRRSNLTFVFNELTMTEKKEFLEENGTIFLE